MTSSVDDTSAALHGCTVAVTREIGGELARRFEAIGATVVHVPLIEVSDAEPGDVASLHVALSGPLDWLVVTSAAGADRVAAIADRPDVRLAAVGTATARRLAEVAGRPVDLVPGRQLAVALVAEFALVQPTPCRILIAQADRAGRVVSGGLLQSGHAVTAITAYRTSLRTPDRAELDSLADADIVTFASGSAATAWAGALGATTATSPGTTLPPIVVAIGPTTAAAALAAGLKVTHVSTDHSVDGLVQTVVDAWCSRRVSP